MFVRAYLRASTKEEDAGRWISRHPFAVTRAGCAEPGFLARAEATKAKTDVDAKRLNASAWKSSNPKHRGTDDGIGQPTAD